MTDAPPIIDFNRLTDEGAREEARRAAYAAVFGTQQGRLVLADILLGSGIAAPRVARADPDLRAFQDGREAVALEIFKTASFEEVDAAAAIMTAGDNIYVDQPTDEPDAD